MISLTLVTGAPPVTQPVEYDRAQPLAPYSHEQPLPAPATQTQ